MDGVGAYCSSPICRHYTLRSKILASYFFVGCSITFVHIQIQSQKYPKKCIRDLKVVHHRIFKKEDNFENSYFSKSNDHSISVKLIFDFRKRKYQFEVAENVTN